MRLEYIVASQDSETLMSLQGQVEEVCTSVKSNSLIFHTVILNWDSDFHRVLVGEAEKYNWSLLSVEILHVSPMSLSFTNFRYLE